MTGTQFKSMMLAAAAKLKAARDELTSIDSQFGDGDHGITMEKIAVEIEKSLVDYEEGGDLQRLLDDLGTAVLGVNGGSAGPLWGTLLGGLAIGLPEGASSVDEEDLRRMFSSSLLEMEDITTAKKGDKTMMDAFIPAVEAINQTEGTCGEMLKAAMEAAQSGAKASENFISKFGRAKSYKEKTLGTPDAGAVSMACFFTGLYEGIESL